MTMVDVNYSQPTPEGEPQPEAQPSRLVGLRTRLAVGATSLAALVGVADIAACPAPVERGRALAVETANGLDYYTDPARAALLQRVNEHLGRSFIEETLPGGQFAGQTVIKVMDGDKRSVPPSRERLAFYQLNPQAAASVGYRLSIMVFEKNGQVDLKRIMGFSATKVDAEGRIVTGPEGRYAQFNAPGTELNMFGPHPNKSRSNRGWTSWVSEGHGVDSTNYGDSRQEIKREDHGTILMAIDIARKAGLEISGPFWDSLPRSIRGNLRTTRV